MKKLLLFIVLMVISGCGESKASEEAWYEKKSEWIYPKGLRCLTILSRTLSCDWETYNEGCRFNHQGNMTCTKTQCSHSEEVCMKLREAFPPIKVVEY